MPYEDMGSEFQSLYTKVIAAMNAVHTSHGTQPQKVKDLVRIADEWYVFTMTVYVYTRWWCDVWLLFSPYEVPVVDWTWQLHLAVLRSWRNLTVSEWPCGWPYWTSTTWRRYSCTYKSHIHIHTISLTIKKTITNCPFLSLHRGTPKYWPMWLPPILLRSLVHAPSSSSASWTLRSC